MNGNNKQWQNFGKGFNASYDDFLKSKKNAITRKVKLDDIKIDWSDPSIKVGYNKELLQDMKRMMDYPVFPKCRIVVDTAISFLDSSCIIFLESQSIHDQEIVFKIWEHMKNVAEGYIKSINRDDGEFSKLFCKALEYISGNKPESMRSGFIHGHARQFMSAFFELTCPDENKEGDLTQDDFNKLQYALDRIIKYTTDLLKENSKI